ncbi:hypothetical protein GF359_07035 [candidate division WOR-3 bacterium]|uniref:PilN domain-containing protein n=1 Tax=candidate division WOR-3 bacterium TaxID=2052148 RepID=A0A9D5K9H1_UNCW3|nr:hypothetical protein [candidate division WOR-3 bacterium]MBD3364953.1 hypothetical protein [candidate division WOR-3 bacterium]
MIKVDLSVQHPRKRMTLIQFILLFVGIFVGVVLIVSVALLLKWNSLTNIADNRNELKGLRDSLSLQKAEMTDYNSLRSRYNEIVAVRNESYIRLDDYSEILSMLNTRLEPGMRLISCRIDSDSAVAVCLSPSNVKVARYLETLSESEVLTFDRSEPQGSRGGLIEHRVVLRIP